MIVAGASAYPRILDFARFRQIADTVGAVFLVDMAHISGLVAGRTASESLPVCRHRNHHHPQNAARSARPE